MGEFLTHIEIRANGKLIARSRAGNDEGGEIVLTDVEPTGAAEVVVGGNYTIIANGRQTTVMCVRKEATYTYFRIIT